MDKEKTIEALYMDILRQSEEVSRQDRAEFFKEAIEQYKEKFPSDDIIKSLCEKLQENVIFWENPENIYSEGARWWQF